MSTGTGTVAVVKVNPGALAKELEFVSAVSEKTTIPVLGMVRLVVSDNVLRLAKTNLDVTAQSSIDVDGVNGGLCVDLKRLRALVGGFNAEECKLEFSQDSLTVKARDGRGKDAKYTLAGRKVEDFPDVVSVEGQVAKVPTAILKAILSATQWSVNPEEYNKHGLTHVLGFRITPTSVQMNATDNRTFVRAEVRVENAVSFEVGLIRVLFAGLPKLFTGSSNETVITLGDSMINFSNGVRSLSAQLPSGNLPKYDLVFQQKNQHVCDFEKGHFFKALGRLSVIADDTVKAVKPIVLELSDDQIEITAECMDVGKGSDGFAVSNGLESFRARYSGFQLMQMMANCEAENIKYSATSGAVRFDADWMLDESTKLSYTTLSSKLNDQPQS